jgi:hypothetical protein
MKHLRLSLQFLGILSVLLVINLGMGYFAVENGPVDDIYTSKELSLWLLMLISLFESIIFGFLWFIIKCENRKSQPVWDELDRYQQMAEEANDKRGCEIVFDSLRNYSHHCRGPGQRQQTTNIIGYLRGKYDGFERAEKKS